MLVEVIHLNGGYDPTTHSHVPPIGLQAGYYEKVVSRLKTAHDLGATVIYRPNLTDFTQNVLGDLDEVTHALDTDPFLAMIADLDGLQVLPDGIEPPEQAKQRRELEDALLKELGEGVVLGAYLGECVPNIAWNLASRNPGISVGLDSSLSISRGISDIRPEFGNLPHIPIVS